MKKLPGRLFFFRWNYILKGSLILMMVLASSGCSQFGRMLLSPYLKFANWIDQQTSGYGVGDKKVESEFEELGLADPQGDIESKLEDAYWQCRDVAGEISAQEAMTETISYGIKGVKLISTKLDMDLQGAPDRKLFYRFNLDIEREDAIIDAATETISGYENLHWTKTGSVTVGISENGVFSDTMEVSVNQVLSGASSGTYNSTEQHAFFGLIPPENLSMAYICDRSANQIPGGLENLTVENFRSYCQPGYYYECDLTR